MVGLVGNYNQIIKNAVECGQDINQRRSLEEVEVTSMINSELNDIMEGQPAIS